MDAPWYQYCNRRRLLPAVLQAVGANLREEAVRRSVLGYVGYANCYAATSRGNNARAVG